MPDKASEEKANLAKKLAEQRAKGVEGIPTTAKVRHPRTFIDNVNKKVCIYRISVFSFLSFNYFIFKSSAQNRRV